MKIPDLGFLDVETIPAWPSFKEMPERLQALFKKKFKHIVTPLYMDKFVRLGLPPNDPKETDALVQLSDIEWEKFYQETAALHAEFNKIVCISIGAWALADDKKPESGQMFVKAFCGTDEVALLNHLDFILKNSQAMRWVAHNGFDFDFPLLQKKYWMHNLPVPDKLKTYGLKTWDVPLEDTIVIWKGTEWKAKISLDLLCECLGIPSPKGTTDGSQVNFLYKAGKLGEIAVYCNGDVKANILAYCRLTAQAAPTITVLPFK